MRVTGEITSSLRPEHDASTTQIIRRELYSHFITGQYTDVMHPHFAGNVTENHMPVFQLHAKRSVGEILKNLALHLNDIVFRHAYRFLF